MTDDTQTDNPTKIDWLKTLAGALAAVTTAVLLSTLGAAGTLIGAALGSIVVTVSSQLYAQGLARSKRTMAKAQETALSKVGIAQAEVRRAGRRQDETGALEAHLEAADDRLDQARAELDVAAPARLSLRERLLLLPWKRIGLLTAGLFLVVLVAIASFEALTGRSVASYTGGSGKDSSSTFTGGGSSDRGDRKDDPKQQPSEEPSEEPSDAPTSEAPSEEPTDEPSETPSDEPTEEPSSTPTDQPTTQPSPTAPTPTP
ncbi:PT domain-containing protein [Nocardioides sp. 503]|uniref:PT domain-containing protein n=1 Tax=Nocardioides sp. 503 TaxID=2508326 RepID=UPI00106F2DE8|nr:PT domain-containing protein [Nocardioides sp. 503]